MVRYTARGDAQDKLFPRGAQAYRETIWTNEYAATTTAPCASL